MLMVRVNRFAAAIDMTATDKHADEIAESRFPRTRWEQVRDSSGTDGWALPSPA